MFGTSFRLALGCLLLLPFLAPGIATAQPAEADEVSVAQPPTDRPLRYKRPVLPDPRDRDRRQEGIPKGRGDTPVAAVLFPTDGAHIDDCEADLPMSGYAWEATSDIVISVWDPRTESWQFAGWGNVDPAGTPFELFGWEGAAWSPFWYWESTEPGNRCPAELKARLRVREFREDRSFFEALTFDDDGLGCFLRELPMSDSIDGTLLDCATGSELTLIAPRSGCGTSFFHRPDCALPLPVDWCDCDPPEPDDQDPDEPDPDEQDPDQPDPDEPDPDEPEPDEDDCEEDKECEVHPRECGGRGSTWKVKGKTVCEDGEEVCVAERGTDYCTVCGGACGECSGGTCSGTNLCAPGMVCAQHDMPHTSRFYCLGNDDCPTPAFFCWTPDEVGHETLPCSP